MFKFITDRPFWVNLIVAVAIVCALFTGFFMSLAGITRHGKVEKVPNVVGQISDQAISTLESSDLRVEIQDSVFIDSLPRGCVVRQSPDGNEDVKIGRTVYLTINRWVAPLIEMPDLHGFSITSAQMLLSNLGLKVGSLSYVADMAKNAVKSQLLNGQELAPGTRVPAGSVISLVLGNGESTTDVKVPSLIGMTLAEAKSYVRSFHLSIGDISADPDVVDENSAVVYSQSPSSGSRTEQNSRISVKIKVGGGHGDSTGGNDELDPSLQ